MARRRKTKQLCTKYITVMNTITWESVPFIRLANGEIKLNSTNKLDNETTCIVTLTDAFYEHSLDFKEAYSKL